ncbi:MerR family transcriptional regulator [Spirosoma sp. SC4-14]|uniref:helix-turn-helix domain-containing protein n=1 Tax=Spirosoma sp. SC4-14 TaxID=3128900 RepID=UPI0030D4FD57
MYIRELSERTGLTPDTIRFYEKLKLIQGNRQHRQGHRQYEESHITTLIQIKFAKAMGFTLKDIQEKLADWHTGRLTDEDKREILTAQLQKMDEAAAQIDHVRQYLRKKIDLLHCHSLQVSNLTENRQLVTLPD